MGRRRKLQALLETFGAAKVYFQPPSMDLMVFPCILFSIDGEDAVHADNKPYRRVLKWQVTIIDREPDSAIRDKVASEPMSSFQRFYIADGLNHFVYNLFF